MVLSIALISLIALLYQNCGQSGFRYSRGELASSSESGQTIPAPSPYVSTTPSPTPSSTVSPTRTPSPTPTTTPPATPTPIPTPPTSTNFPSEMTFSRNNLDFFYSDILSNSTPNSYIEIVLTLDTSNFFNRVIDDGGHLVFAYNLSGESHVIDPASGTRDHCGPIIRHGRTLFDQARGFILLRNGTLAGEHWQAGKAFGVHELGWGFDPISNPIFTVRIRAGYRDGNYGNKMEIDFYKGTSLTGSRLTGASLPWGWNWTGQHGFAFGAIGPFVSPNDTNCSETTDAGSASGAKIPISNFSIRVYNQ
jgi:hypothetical protein